jgi:transketolase
MDCNGLQVDGRTEDIMPLEPIAEKIRAFNWNVVEIDGHDMRQILDAISLAKACTERPTWIVARTVKGKGVPFMENEVDWHGRSPNDAELAQALEGLR